ncbi:protein kinase domain-containing protein [Archangium violaceum]|uniref:protein kinase domain-containing protein n=1 Tax=Archangium violaceum TaxID=83451 RepID=UPI0036D7E22A
MDSAPPSGPSGPSQPGSLLWRGALLGRYVLLEPIGQGGMGIVYAGYDPELDRRVALKWHRPSNRPDDTQEQERLLREARAMARVSHPHVVPIFDVGLFEGGVFLAMELVEGDNLRAWLRHAPRSRREIVSVLLDAGRGLAAAHAAGIVHRDFKPENVMVERHGRGRVLDFGLAHEAAPLQAAAIAGSLTATPGELTETGRVLGTPAYLAPERLAGHSADARSDQFSFCLTLAEALTGHLPFTFEQLQALARGQEVSPRLEGLAGMPAAWRRALLIGLSARPAQRHADLPTLLSLLEGQPRVRRMAMAGAGLLALAAVGLTLHLGREPPCEGAREQVERVWNARAATAMEQAFTRSSSHLAPGAFQAARTRMDEWARRWVEARTEACRATHVRHEQSPETLALKLACLDGRLDSLSTVVRLLQHADEEWVSHAAQVVDGMERVQGCNDVGLLRRQEAGDDARLPGVRRRLDEVRALVAAGKYGPALTAAEATMEEARGLSLPWLSAEARLLEGVAALKAGEADASRRLLEARWLAEAAGLDQRSAEAALQLGVLHLGRQDRERAEEWLGHTRASLTRMGGDGHLEWQLLGQQALLEAINERRDKAAELSLQAVRLAERILGPDHLEVSDALLRAAAYHAVSREGVEHGIALAQRALTLRLSALGPFHPRVAEAHEVLAQLARHRYDHARELQVQQEVLALRTRTLPSSHPTFARTHWGLATAHVLRGDDVSAVIHYREALAGMESAYGAISQKVGVLKLSLAMSERRVGRLDSALALAREGIALLRQVQGQDTPYLTLESSGLADMLAASGQRAEARRLYLSAIETKERVEPSSAKLAPPLLGLARLELEEGHPEQALVHAKRALELQSASFPPPNPNLLEALELVGQAWLRLGQVREAQAVLVQAERAAEEWLPEGHPLRLRVLWMTVAIRQAEGRREEAIQAARAGLALAQSLPGAPLSVAEAQLVLASALGERDASAREVGRQALVFFSRAGERARVQEAPSWLRGR